jgi:hypothetical protein
LNKHKLQKRGKENKSDASVLFFYTFLEKERSDEVEDEPKKSVKMELRDENKHVCAHPHKRERKHVREFRCSFMKLYIRDKRKQTKEDVKKKKRN